MDIQPTDLRKSTKADRARLDGDFAFYATGCRPIRCFRAAAEGMPCTQDSVPLIAARQALALAVARHLNTRREPA